MNLNLNHVILQNMSAHSGIAGAIGKAPPKSANLIGKYSTDAKLPHSRYMPKIKPIAVFSSRP